MVVWNDYATAVSISNSTISANNASVGGGLSILGNSSTVCSYLMLSNNTASGNGGGVEVAGSAQVRLPAGAMCLSLVNLNCSWLADCRVKGVNLAPCIGKCYL